MSTNYIDQITDTAGTTHDISEGDSTRIFRATCPTAAGTTTKVATLQTSNRNFSLTAGVRVAVTFTYGNTATTPTLRVDGSSTGTAKTIAVATSATAKATGNGTTYNTWGPYETILFTYDGTYWVNGGSSRSIYNAYNNIGENTNTWRPIQVDGTQILAGTTDTNALNLKAGTGISLSNNSGAVTFNHSNSVTAKSTQAVYPITFDAQGHITGSGTAVTIPTVPGIATNTTAGLVKPWYYWQQSSTGPTAGTVNSSATVNARSATAGRYYPIEIDKDGRMFVNVPWTNENSAYITTDTNTTYTLSGALSSHKFTSTLTPSSGTATTSDFTLAAGTGITITDTTSSRTMTIACSVTNTDTKVTQAYSTTSNSYPLLMTATAGISSTSSRGATTSILNNQIYANPSTGTITATAFNGAAMATTAYDTANLKNIVESTSDPGTASSYPTGTVWIKYTA